MGLNAKTQSLSNIMKRLRAVILLGGSLTPNPLSVAARRSRLDLPVAPGRSILDHWRDHLEQSAVSIGLNLLTVRLIIDRQADEPKWRHGTRRVSFHLERDPQAYRGTAGILRDISMAYDEDDYILVASAGQLILEPLANLVVELASSASDLSLVAYDDGMPCGLMLIRCECLRKVPVLGYIDLKEQVLPAIASRYRVNVVWRAMPSGMPIRNLDDYIEALRAYRQSQTGVRVHLAEEDCYSLFNIIEDGAVVSPLSQLHDSVVLRGGRVEGGSVLFRSLVGPQGIVRQQTLVRQLIAGPLSISSR